MGQVLIVPLMTSNTAPSGVCAKDTTADGTSAFEAFDQNDTTYAHLGLGGETPNPPHWISYKRTGMQETCVTYRFKTSLYYGTSLCPITWKIYGWNGSAWIEIDSRTNEDALDAGVWSPTYNIGTPTAYDGYKMEVLDWTDYFGDSYDGCTIAALEFYSQSVETLVPAIYIDDEMTVLAPQFTNAEVNTAVPPIYLDDEMTVLAPTYTITPPPTQVPPIYLDDEMTVLAPAFVIEPPAGVPYTTIHRAWLTGSGDSLPDVEIPMASYQGRRRDGSPTYLSIVTPYTQTMLDAIEARPNGQLVVKMGRKLLDGTEILGEIARVDFEEVNPDRGGRNKSLTLTGHATVSTQTPKRRDLTGVEYVSGTSGKRRCRATFDFNLVPGDTAVIESLGEEFVVGLISYIVQAKPPVFIMTLSEAEV